MMTASRLDFTSALFLGLRHPAASLPSWSALTTGVPAALAEHSAAQEIAERVAGEQSAEAGLVERSTLHALADVFAGLAKPGDTVAVDQFAYPTMTLAAGLAGISGATVRQYGHHRWQSIPAASRRLILATDGWCAGCGRPAPLGELAGLARRTGGFLVVDDSLAAGVLGCRTRGECFGDGTGTLRWLGQAHDGVVWVASFAKAYGTPVTVVTGPAELLRVLDKQGSRVHSSPSSTPELLAMRRALSMRPELRLRRHRLDAVVQWLRARLRAGGYALNGLPFPVVGLPMPTAAALRYWSALRANGVDVIVQEPRCRSGSLLSFVLRSDHSVSDLARVVALMLSIRSGRAAA